jgi:antitoxin ParD1/3/4
LGKNDIILGSSNVDIGFQLREPEMDISLGERWQNFVDEAVKSGRFRSADDVVCEGLRLVAEREAKLAELQETLAQSIARGGQHSRADVDRRLEAVAASLAKEGY